MTKKINIYNLESQMNEWNEEIKESFNNASAEYDRLLISLVKKPLLNSEENVK